MKTYTKSRSLIVSLCLCFALSATVFAADGYVCSCKKGFQPKMDGQLDGDVFWANVPSSRDFRLLGMSANKPNKRTWFKMAYNETALLIGVWCEEPAMAKLKAGAEQGGSVWKDDSIEIFIAPSRHESYLQYIVNTAGVRYNGLNVQATALGDWQAACHRGADFYSIEIRIPFALLQQYPGTEECWTGNIGRNITTGSDVHTTWARLPGGYHDPAGFAPLAFPERVAGPGGDAQSVNEIRMQMKARLDEVQAIAGRLRPEQGFDVRLLRAEYDEARKSYGASEHGSLRAVQRNKEYITVLAAWAREVEAKHTVKQVSALFTMVEE